MGAGQNSTYDGSQGGQSLPSFVGGNGSATFGLVEQEVLVVVALPFVDVVAAVDTPVVLEVMAQVVALVVAVVVPTMQELTKTTVLVSSGDGMVEMAHNLQYNPCFLSKNHT